MDGLVASPQGPRADGGPGRCDDPDIASAAVPGVEARSKSGDRVDFPRVTVEVRHLAASGEPARVSASWPRCACRRWRTKCTIDVVEEGGHRYRIRQPAPDRAGEICGRPDLAETPGS